MIHQLPAQRAPRSHITSLALTLLHERECPGSSYFREGGGSRTPFFKATGSRWQTVHVQHVNNPSPAALRPRLRSWKLCQGLVGNVVQSTRRVCVCRQPAASLVTGVSVALRAGGPRAGRRRRFHWELGAAAPGSAVRGRAGPDSGARSSWSSAELQVRCSRGRQAAGHPGRDPGSAPPVPRSQSHLAARQRYLAGQPWLGPRCEGMGDPLSEAWEDLGPPSGSPAFVSTAARDPPSACGSKGGWCRVGPGRA